MELDYEDEDIYLRTDRLKELVALYKHKRINKICCANEMIINNKLKTIISFNLNCIFIFVYIQKIFVRKCVFCCNRCL